MRLELVKNIKGNEILSKSIYNQLGALVLPKGQRLEAKMKNRLIENGVFFVYLKDENNKLVNKVNDSFEEYDDGIDPVEEKLKN